MYDLISSRGAGKLAPVTLQSGHHYLRRSGSEDFRDDSPIEMARGGGANFSTNDDENFQTNSLQIFIVYVIRLLSRQKLHTSQSALVPV